MSHLHLIVYKSELGSVKYELCKSSMKHEFRSVIYELCSMDCKERAMICEVWIMKYKLSTLKVMYEMRIIASKYELCRNVVRRMKYELWDMNYYVKYGPWREVWSMIYEI